MPKIIEIVDRGRGPQLSSNRITVQDLVPYFQRHCSYAEMMEIMPALTLEEIKIVEHYIQENHETVEKQDRHIRERAASRRSPPEVEVELRKARRERLERARQAIREQQERNGDCASG